MVVPTYNSRRLRQEDPCESEAILEYIGKTLSSETPKQ